jgi:hypothetical protein
MRAIILGTAAAGWLAACGSEPQPKAEPQQKADALQPGEYELTAVVDSVRSTDNTTPATNMKVAAAGEETEKVRLCVAQDGAIDPLIFAEAGDQCTPSSSYMRRGRMSLQFNCNRPKRGQLTQLVDGNFTAGSFEAKVITSSYFEGAGDYSMTRTLTGKRVGQCPAAQPAGGAAANAAADAAGPEPEDAPVPAAPAAQ